MAAGDSVETELKTFADAVRTKFEAPAKGEPEEQLRAPMERLLTAIGAALGHEVVAKGESLLDDKVGKPDYAVVVDQALSGYLELKAPGTGATVSRLRGRDKEQWGRFKSLPNILYSDGISFALYRTGERVGPIVELAGDPVSEGSAAIGPKDAVKVRSLFANFLSWEPVVPSSPPKLAEVMAPLCRLLRDAVIDALEDTASPLAELKKDWQSLLFPDADDRQFADAYAQTVVYALLLARAEGAPDGKATTAVVQLEGDHALLARALQVLTDAPVRKALGSVLELLERTAGALDPATLTGGQPDPWLYFYEDFLSAYDPKLRRDTGVYYTPVEVVRAQVRLSDELLRTKLGRSRGFAEDDVLTLDPAVGTGTYLLGIVDYALSRVERSSGAGAVPGRATVLAENLYGFEIMVGPYAVAQLRLTRELKARKATLPKDGIKVFLTDTLENPSAAAPQPPLFVKPIADQHRRAQQVKDNIPILVCIGNPPYDRHDASSKLGGWVRYGAKGQDPLLEDFLAPAVSAGRGVDLKNVYNLYVYFWRWALWKVFEHGTARGPGIVSFITASSYLHGNAFTGMRQLMRSECDEIWIIDLGGDRRGTRKEENVFAIQSPVAIAIAARYGAAQTDAPAAVHYTRIHGNRATKLATLDQVNQLADLNWEDCPSGWQDPFRPAGAGVYFRWPRLTELFPWQHSGVEVKRTWPIGADAATLRRRWQHLLSGPRASLFRETRDRKVKKRYRSDVPQLGGGESIDELDAEAPAPKAVPYAYRSFDRHLILADYRLIDFPRPALWRSHSDRQIYLTTLLTDPLGAGPGVTFAASIPDRHHFSGRGGKDTIPLYRDARASQPNIRPGLLDRLGAEYGKPVSAEDLFAYVAGVVAHPAYTATLEPELETPGPRVPVTRDPALFDQAADLGRRVIWLQTFGQRFADLAAGRPARIPAGQARNTHPVSQDPERYPREYHYDADAQELRVGDGVFAPVTRQMYEYEVSGLVVIKSWLGYRMRERAGKSSSELDRLQPERWTAELTDQLLELLWALEGIIALEPAQKALLETIVKGPLFEEADLPELADDHPMREAPAFARQDQLL